MGDIYVYSHGGVEAVTLNVIFKNRGCLGMVWDFKGEKGNSQQYGKQCLVNKSLLGFAEITGHVLEFDLSLLLLFSH